MTLLLQTRPGTVVRMDDPSLQCRISFFRVESPQLLFDEQKSIVTRLTVSEQTNVQFLHAMGRMIYVYVFGDRIGEMTLSGLSFPCDCTGDVNGAERMLLYYRRNRSSRRRLPVRVMLGNTPIEGLVVRYGNDVVDASLNLTQWTLVLNTFPPDDDPLDEPATTTVPANFGGSQPDIPPPEIDFGGSQPNIPPPELAVSPTAAAQIVAQLGGGGLGGLGGLGGVFDFPPPPPNTQGASGAATTAANIANALGTGGTPFGVFPLDFGGSQANIPPPDQFGFGGSQFDIPPPEQIDPGSLTDLINELSGEADAGLAALQAQFITAFDAFADLPQSPNLAAWVRFRQLFSPSTALQVPQP